MAWLTLRCLADTIDRLQSSVERAPQPRSQTDRDLIEISNKCSTTAKELLDELGKLKLDPQASRREAFSKVFRVIRRKDFISEVQKKLDKYQRTLDTCILTRLEARSFQQTEDLQNLDESVQGLVAGLKQGHNTVAQLLVDQNKAIRDIEHKIDDHARVDRTLLAQRQFKESLFYPEILSRQEQIPDAYRGTCRWIFRPPGTKHGGSNDTDSDELSGFRSDDVSFKAGEDADEHDDDESRSSQPWPNFVDWLENGQGAYWINGKPGSGKSTLMAYLDHEPQTQKCLKTWTKGSDIVTASFFFWNAGTVLQKSLQGLLRSLLYQIADQREDLISLMMEPRGNETMRPDDLSNPAQLHAWTEQRLLSTLRRFLTSKPASICMCFFVDGLDEFVGDEDTLLETIELLNSTPRVKACVSSRPEMIFQQAFRESLQLRVQDLNHRDIERMATEKLFPNLEKHFPGESKEIKSLISQVIFSAQGVFLWLELVIKDIIKGARHADTMQELQARPEIIPDTVEGLYAHMLSRLDKLYLQESIRYFQLLMTKIDVDPYGTLTLLQLACGHNVPWEHVLMNNLSYFESAEFHNFCNKLETRVLTRCAGLIEIGKSWINPYRHRGWTRLAEQTIRKKQMSSFSREVRFIHRTVKDFLKSHYQGFFHAHDWPSAPLLIIARGCVGMIYLAPALTSSEIIRSPNVDMVVPVMNTMFVIGTVDELRIEDDAFLDLVDHTYRIADHVDRSNYRVNGLQFHDPAGLAAYCGVHKYISRFLSSRAISYDSLNNSLISAVLSLSFRRPYSSLSTRLAIIEMILRRGADPNIVLHRYHVGIFDGVFEATPWALFLLSAMRVTELTEDVDDVALLWHRVGKTFLSSGADINTSILYNSRFDSPIHDGDLILEESPLLYWERTFSRARGLSSQALPIVKGLHTLLRFRGAPERRRFRAIIFWTVDTLPLVCCRLSKSQSDRLLKAWQEPTWGPSTSMEDYVNETSLHQAVHDLRSSLAEDDMLDPSDIVISSSHRPIRRASF